MICAVGEEVSFGHLAVNQRFDVEPEAFDFVKTSPRRWLRVNGDAATVKTIRFAVIAGPMDSSAAATHAAKGRGRHGL